MRFIAAIFMLSCLCLAPVAGLAQQVAFGGIRADISAPVEVTADSLSVNQTDGTAVFTGNVLIVQGTMRLQAAQVTVEYGNAERSKIDRLHATGGVTLVSDAEAAEAKEALYDVTAGTVVMTGDVLLTQGKNVMAGQKLSVDLSSGTGQMDGRVRTILQPGTTP
jgi:lipopolysaccharide export system protein LptA